MKRNQALINPGILVVVVTLLLTLFAFAQGCASRRRAKVSPVPDASKDYEFRCRDEAGRPVNWFIAYKLAKIRESSIRLIKDGHAYAYLTADSSQWQLSERSIALDTSMVGRSLRPLYSGTVRTDPKQLYLLYNDQPPKRAAVSYNGHTKGVILAGEKGGIWFQHSVPKFPDISGAEFDYPSSGENNAQLLFCLSLSAENLDAVVGETLLHIKPTVYNHSVPEGLKKVYSKLAKLVAKGRKKNVEPSKVLSLIEGSVNLTIFAKGPKYEKDIYAEWLAPTLDCSLKVQSWLNGVNSMDSNCESQQYQILNIVDKQVLKHRFSTQKDHSKWAISEKSDWTCLSDLNRMESQKSRGGAAICIKDRRVWNSFDNSVLDVQPCGISGRRRPKA